MRELLRRTPTHRSAGTGRTSRRRRSLAGVAAGAALVLGATACSSSSSSTPAASDSASAKGTVVIGTATFTSGALMGAMYQALLESKGFTVQTKAAENRELYYPELIKGNINVIPEYAATFAEFVNAKVNGSEAATAKPVATTDATTTVAAINTFGTTLGFEALTPSKAVDQNAFAVTKEFSTTNSVTTLSQLGALGQPIKMAAPEECPTRQYCGIVLTQTYKINITGYVPGPFDSPAVKTAVKNGDAQLGLVSSLAADLDTYGLVRLEDDLSTQLADNLTPVVSKDFESNTDVTDALDSLSAVLTSDDLIAMVQKVDSERQLPADVATAYLTDKGLIS